MRRPLLCWTTTVTAAIVLAGALTTVAPAPSQATSQATSQAPPTAVERRTDPPQSAALTQALRKVERAGAVGVVAEVIDRGAAWRGATGAARLSPRHAAVPTARFRAASMTKQLMAVLALQEVAAGRWSLDTTIGDVLPRLWPEKSSVTLAQLLSHRSGLPDVLTALVAKARSNKQFLHVVSQPRSERSLVRVAQGLDPLFAPGTSYGYSNTNYIVVAMMLRAATGERVGDLVAERVLRPARMTRSRYALDRRFPTPRLREYADFGGRRLLDLSSFSPSMFAGSGALVSTATDLNRFHYALSTGRLLSKRLVTTMRSVVSGPEEAGVPYGYGSYRIADPCRPGGWLYGHDGASWGTHTLSYSSADGRRRVTAAMTGRQFTEKQPAFAALNTFVVTAFASTCRGGSSRTALPPTTTRPAAEASRPGQLALR